MWVCDLKDHVNSSTDCSKILIKVFDWSLVWLRLFCGGGWISHLSSKPLTCYCPKNIYSSLISYYKLSFSVITHGSLAITSISPLFVDRFRRSLRFCHIEFEKEAISDRCRIENARYRWGFLNFKWFFKVFGWSSVDVFIFFNA